MRITLLLLIAICFVFQVKPMSQCKFPGQGNKRDLTQYDKAGPYRFDNELHPREADKLLGELRDFLWQHWKEQRLGLVTATFYTIEGDPTDSRYFVERNASGVWYLRVESRSTISAFLPKGQKPKIKSTCDDYDKVDRVEPSRATTVNPVRILDTEIRNPQTYRLRLTNSNTRATLIL